MARISTGKSSKQDYQTPKKLIDACIKRFGNITIDLAATNKNRVLGSSTKYLAPLSEIPLDSQYPVDCLGYNSLQYDWHIFNKQYGGIMWLNPPFNDVPTWAAKCYIEGKLGANLLFLIPYRTTKGFMKYVEGKADLYLLEGRLSFIPGKSFPVDCVIAHYHQNSGNKVCFWNWKKDTITNIYKRKYDE